MLFDYTNQVYTWQQQKRIRCSHCKYIHSTFSIHNGNEHHHTQRFLLSSVDGKMEMKRIKKLCNEGYMYVKNWRETEKQGKKFFLVFRI